MDARKTGDPIAIGQASKQVIALALVEMAKFRLDQKAYDEAIRLCVESLEFEDTAETRVEVAILSLYAKKPSDAVKQATAATQLDPQNSLAWTIKGEALLRSRNYDGAAKALSIALEVKRGAQSLYGLGVAQLGMGETQRAAETFSQFLALTGDFGWSRVLVGRAYQEQALQQEAEMEFQKALLLDPATPNAHYFWALTLMRANTWNPNAEVYSHLRAELHLNPRHFEANYVLGFLASTARNYKESDRYLHLASQVKPLVPETWVLLGLNAQKRGANRIAEAYFRKAIALAKNLDPREHFEVRKAYTGLGRLLMASGRTKEAEELLSKARKLQAQNLAEARESLGAIDGKNEEEGSGSVAPYVPESDSGRVPSFSRLSKRDSLSKPEALSKTRDATPSPSGLEEKTEKHLGAILGASFNDLATAEALQEKYQEAFNHYGDAAQWDSAIPGLQRNLGLAAYFAGEPADASRLLSKVVTQSPADAHARAVLGLAYFATNDFAKAVQALAPIAGRTIQDPQLGIAWAKSLAETGNRRGALRALQNMDRPDANLGAESLVQFGKLWQKLGESERAARSFRRALVIDPGNADAKCALGMSECP